MKDVGGNGEEGWCRRIFAKREDEKIEKGRFSTSFNMLSYAQFAMHPGDDNC